MINVSEIGPLPTDLNLNSLRDYYATLCRIIRPQIHDVLSNQGEVSEMDIRCSVATTAEKYIMDQLSTKANLKVKRKLALEALDGVFREFAMFTHQRKDPP